MGIEVEVMDFGFRAAADPDRLETRLRADGARELAKVSVGATLKRHGEQLARRILG